jgi:transposase
MPRRRRKFDAQLKAKIVLAAVEGRSSIGELAQQYDIQPNLIYVWKRQLEEQAARIFERPRNRDITRQIEQLHAKIGELMLECDRFSEAKKPERTSSSGTT